MQFSQKIAPCLWFDSQGEEAANFYVGIFPNSKHHIASRATARRAWRRTSRRKAPS